MDAAVMAQIVIEPPVALIRAFLMELFELFSKPLILCGPLAVPSRFMRKFICRLRLSEVSRQ